MTNKAEILKCIDSSIAILSKNIPDNERTYLLKEAGADDVHIESLKSEILDSHINYFQAVTKANDFCDGVRKRLNSAQRKYKKLITNSRRK